MGRCNRTFLANLRRINCPDLIQHVAQNVGVNSKEKTSMNYPRKFQLAIF